MNSTVTYVTLVIALIIGLIPYVTVVLQHINSKRIERVTKFAEVVTRALEETNLPGAAKKQVATSELQSLIKKIPFFNISPKMLDKYIDSAVVKLREAGIKTIFIDTPDEVEEVTEEV